MMLIADPGIIFRCCRSCLVLSPLPSPDLTVLSCIIRTSMKYAMLSYHSSTGANTNTLASISQKRVNNGDKDKNTPTTTHFLHFLANCAIFRK